MKYLATLFLLYSQCAIPEHIPEEWQRKQFVLGAPCSLKSDYIGGTCYVPEVKHKPDWR